MPPNDGTQNESRVDLRVALKIGAGQLDESELGDDQLYVDIIMHVFHSLGHSVGCFAKVTL